MYVMKYENFVDIAKITRKLRPSKVDIDTCRELVKNFQMDDARPLLWRNKQACL